MTLIRTADAWSVSFSKVCSRGWGCTKRHWPGPHPSLIKCGSGSAVSQLDSGYWTDWYRVWTSKWHIGLIITVSYCPKLIISSWTESETWSVWLPAALHWVVGQLPYQPAYSLGKCVSAQSDAASLWYSCVAAVCMVSFHPSPEFSCSRNLEKYFSVSKRLIVKFVLSL